MLEQCAARRRAVEGTAGDEALPFIAALQPPRDMLVHDEGFAHPRKVRRRPPPAYDIAVEPSDILEPDPTLLIQPDEQYRSGPEEMDWRMLDDEEGMAAIEEASAEVRAAIAQRTPRTGRRPATRLRRCVASAEAGRREGDQRSWWRGRPAKSPNPRKGNPENNHPTPPPGPACPGPRAGEGSAASATAGGSCAGCRRRIGRRWWRYR